MVAYISIVSPTITVVDHHPSILPGQAHYVPPGTGPCCASKYRNYYYCTRDCGHPGMHVGHGDEDAMIASWSGE